MGKPAEWRLHSTERWETEKMHRVKQPMPFSSCIGTTGKRRAFIRHPFAGELFLGKISRLTHEIYILLPDWHWSRQIDKRVTHHSKFPPALRIYRHGGGAVNHYRLFNEASA